MSDLDWDDPDTDVCIVCGEPCDTWFMLLGTLSWIIEQLTEFGVEQRMSVSTVATSGPRDLRQIARTSKPDVFEFEFAWCTNCAARVGFVGQREPSYLLPGLTRPSLCQFF